MGDSTWRGTWRAAVRVVVCLKVLLILISASFAQSTPGLALRRPSRVAAGRATERPAEEKPRQYLQIFSRQFPLGDESVPAEIRQKLGAPAQREVRDLRGTAWEATSRGLVQVE